MSFHNPALTEMSSGVIDPVMSESRLENLLVLALRANICMQEIPDRSLEAGRKILCCYDRSSSCELEKQNRTSIAAWTFRSTAERRSIS